MVNRLLFKKIDNSPLILFRIFFGILIALESFGAIATGWVKRNLIDPKIHFTFIDFEWLQPLPGNGMYFYFIAMGVLGVFVSIGYKYRLSIVGFTILWMGAYLMQKTAYNNHYYLLVLVSAIMCLLPANRSHSIDVKRQPTLKTNAMFGYIKWVVILQLFVVYTFASIAKIYGDWLDFSMVKVLMSPKKNYLFIGPLLQEPWIHSTIAITGIIFDLLIVPALLWKPTRKIAFALSIFFHLFNAIVFQIGIFPFLSLAFTVFFFEAETIRKLFFKQKTPYLKNEIAIPSYKNALLIIGSIYFGIQMLLPLRHYFIKDNVLWTEEGHRMSWRMMLRSRSGMGVFVVQDTFSKKTLEIIPHDYLTKSQQRKVFAYPDFAWQFAQHLAKTYKEQGKDVAVYLKNSKISINNKPLQPFIDGNVDLAAEKWKAWQHHHWILPSHFEE